MVTAHFKKGGYEQAIYPSTQKTQQNHRHCLWTLWYRALLLTRKLISHYSPERHRLMELDNAYTHIYQCPTNDEQVTYNQTMQTHGVCHVCGHQDQGTMTHARKISGQWSRPTYYEWLLGKRKEFVPKVTK